MRKLLPVIIALGIAYLAAQQWGWGEPSEAYSRRGGGPTETGLVRDGNGRSADRIARAFQNRESDVLVEGRGEVVRVLADDNDGSRHQRFILRLSSGQTLLVAHNIDLAPRLAGLKAGDEVEFFGEYEWNEQGGVLHWTHKDPRGNHPAGWLRYRGETYQ
jgi:hypothetical protein